MQNEQAELNRFLVEIFHDILKIEEQCISCSRFSNLSVREMHVIETVCMAEEEKNGQKAADIAKRLNITAGSLTTAVALLEKKGYLKRRRDAYDKRVVRIQPTRLGHAANAVHQAFHADMVKDVLRALREEEIPVLLRALRTLSAFFQNTVNDSEDTTNG